MQLGTHGHVQREGRTDVRTLKLPNTHWHVIQITHAADTEHMEHGPQNTRETIATTD